MDSNPTTIETDKIIAPRRSAAIIALLNSKNLDHPLAKKYLEEFEKYEKQLSEVAKNIPKKEVIELPELQPVDIESLYEVFKKAYNFFNNKEFDENANDGEGKILARTIIYYFLQHSKFYRSPAIYTNLNVSDLDKGLMIIGGFGCGKTSIVKTFHQMFHHAASNPITVKDIEGTTQFLGRYKLGFGFRTTNDVVDDYEVLSADDEKKAFWKNHAAGFKYYDDLMTERTASNYGKVEIFKDIIEKRYNNGAKTMVSLNYSGNSVEETLEALSQKYGERVYDRVFEMFNIIVLNGKSFRK